MTITRYNEPHTTLEAERTMLLSVTALPALADNYIWLIDNGTEAVAIDPSIDTPVLSHIQRNQLILTHILITHHHSDHITGALPLSQQTQAVIYAPLDQRIPTHHTCRDQDVLTLFHEKVPVQVFHTPGHTETHLSYFINHTSLFCGDILFSAGCGKNFEGKEQDIFYSLQWIASLPDNTLLYPAHEYTLSNLYFALHVEPDNQNIADLIQALENKTKPYCSLPTTVSREKKINPFLRFLYSDCIKESIKKEFYVDPKEVTNEQLFMLLRRWKSGFHRK